MKPGRMLGLLLPVTLLGLGLPFGVAAPPDSPKNAVDSHPSQQLVRGRDLYERRCSVCHGETGGGLEEARLAFPEDHRMCERCHKTGTTPLLRYPFQDNNMFDVGKAPKLYGSTLAERFPDRSALRAYIQAAMPRHAPGSLSRDDSADLTAFVLTLTRTVPPKNDP